MYREENKLREIPNKVRIQLEDFAFIWVRKISLALFIASCLGIVFEKGLQTEILLFHKAKTTTARLIPILEQVERGAQTNEHIYSFTGSGNKKYYGSFYSENNVFYDTPIKVMYHPQFPSRNKKVATYKLGFITLIVICLIALLLWISSKYDFFINRDNKIRIAEYGEFAPGVIQARIRDKKSRVDKYRYYIVYRTKNDKLMKELFISTKKLSTSQPILVMYLLWSPKKFIVIDDLPVLAQRYFKNEAGLSNFTLMI